jgi:Zn-dependent protease
VAGSALAGTEWLQLVHTVAWINFGLLIFNMLPVYPLDGGQILQSLLWFGIGRAKSLLVVTITGALAGVALAIYGLMQGDWWVALIGGFILMRCKAGFEQSRLIAQHEATAR